MDRFLSRDEMKELMDLLNVPAHCYGNMAMLKINYKKMSKIYHPDKGGDAAKMKRMNELWQKLADNICSARQESGYQVSAWLFGDFQTCKDFLGPKFKDKVCKVYPNCVLSPKEECTCLVCMLARQHRIYKIWKRQPCMVWGECFCYKCFLLWFGLPENEESISWWAQIIGDTELHLLNLFHYGNLGKFAY
ncbi:small T antigen [Rhinolophus pearsonii polyomavirus 2]|nr:small T antigen [Rhinolophus pearsonii polyomavirus 2]